MRNLPFWSEAPPVPPSRQPLTRFLRPSPGRPLRVLCLSSAPFSIWTHWRDGRTQPCSDPTDLPACACGLPRRWCAYIAALTRGSLAQVGVMLTAGGVAYLAPPDDDGPAWRGRVLTLSRSGTSARAPQSILREPYTEPQRPLPPAADLRAALSILWGGSA